MSNKPLVAIVVLALVGGGAYVWFDGHRDDDTGGGGKKPAARHDEAKRVASAAERRAAFEKSFLAAKQAMTGFKFPPSDAKKPEDPLDALVGQFNDALRT